MEEDREITKLCGEYEETYKLAKDLRKGGARHDSVRYGARLELGMRERCRRRRLSSTRAGGP